MANLFAASNSPVSYTFDYLKSYLQFISEMIPYYVQTDFSKYAVYKCVEKFPDLYRIIQNENEIVIKSNIGRPNLEYFNATYPIEMSNYIKNISKYYVRKNRK